MRSATEVLYVGPAAARVFYSATVTMGACQNFCDCPRKLTGSTPPARLKVEKGKGLVACTSSENPTLRAEAQVFLVVNDPNTGDFNMFDYKGSASADGRHNRVKS